MNELQIFNTNLTKEILTNESSLKVILTDIEGLKSLAFDFTTAAGVKQAKALKTQANKFVKELKEFCEPLEAEGKKISDARSKISTRLISGKSNVIDEILQPINEIEERLKSLRDKFAVPLNDINTVVTRLNELEISKKQNWLIYQEEATGVIEQLQGLALVKKQTLEEEAKTRAEEEQKARIAREEQIRAEEKARAEQAILNAEKRAAEAEKFAAERERQKIENEKLLAEQEKVKRESDVEHKRKINGELAEHIALAIGADGSMIRDEAIIFARKIVVAVAKGSIPNISIQY